MQACKVRLHRRPGVDFRNRSDHKNTFYYLASQGVPIRLRYNPTWYPEIDHWKAAIFAARASSGSDRRTSRRIELTPCSSTNYNDERHVRSRRFSLVNAFKTKFDQVPGTTPIRSPKALIPTAPYFKNWDDACATESRLFRLPHAYPNPVRMVINTARLEPDYPLPPEMVWGQGPAFNNRLDL